MSPKVQSYHVLNKQTQKKCLGIPITEQQTSSYQYICKMQKLSEFESGLSEEHLF